MHAHLCASTHLCCLQVCDHLRTNATIALTGAAVFHTGWMSVYSDPSHQWGKGTGMSYSLHAVYFTPSVYDMIDMLHSQQKPSQLRSMHPGVTWRSVLMVKICCSTSLSPRCHAKAPSSSQMQHTTLQPCARYSCGVHPLITVETD